MAKIKEELPAELQAVVDKLAGLEQQKRDGALVPAYEIACELKKLKEGDMEFSDAVDKLRESLSWSQRTIDRYIKVREAIPPADFEELRAVRCSKGVRALSWTHFQILSRVSGKSDRKNVVKAWQKSDNDVDGVRSMEQMVNKMLKSGQDDPVPEMTAAEPAATPPAPNLLGSLTGPFPGSPQEPSNAPWPDPHTAEPSLRPSHHL